MKTTFAKILAAGAVALAAFTGGAQAVDDYCGTPYPGWPLPPGPYARMRVEPDPEPWRVMPNAGVARVRFNLGNTAVVPGAGRLGSMFGPAGAGR
jgi:hypothetical protein